MTDRHQTQYFTGEGRTHMRDCMHAAVETCHQLGIDRLVIFTGNGDGPHYVAREHLKLERYKNLRVVAVTPPAGRPYRSDITNPESPMIRAGVPTPMRDELRGLGVPVVSAHLPFKEMYNGTERRSEWTRVNESFGIFGGGVAYCIQAVLVACDAGELEHGARVVAATADTAIVIEYACRTESFLSPLEGMLVGHIICRPAHYDISKRLHERNKPPVHAPAPRRLEAPEAPRLATGTVEVLGEPKKRTRRTKK